MNMTKRFTLIILPFLVWLALAQSAENYSIKIEPPNGHRIPKIMGASGDQALITGYDYFNWYGITEHRTWFKPSFSSLADNSQVTSAEAFIKAVAAIRKNPTRQATSDDYYIDWQHFYNQRDRQNMKERLSHLTERNIAPLINNTTFISKTPITDDWVNKFKYWKYWYTMVYHFSSVHNVTMYAFRNEPHAHIDYDPWESHWLVCADAMQKAMADVNRDFKKDLKLNICGPNCPGVYWDTKFSHPDQGIHCWSRVSWKKVKYDLFGKYDVTNPRNYGSYHFHRYGEDATRSQKIILDARKDIASADNDPSPDIPLIITEYNTSTGGNFDRRSKDTEDILFGISMAQILQASAIHGPKGLGNDGGIFVFKLGAHQGKGPLVGIGNKLSYVSNQKPHNYGGITRGGACYQLYARHFRGGKPILPITTLSGKHDKLRTVAAVDEEYSIYYIYGSNCSRSDVSVSIDLKALNVRPNILASLHRVDEKNTGQVTDIISVSNDRGIAFEAPNYTAFLIKIPMAGSLSSYRSITPSDDATASVKNTDLRGSANVMAIANHHSDAKKRHVGLVKFKINDVKAIGRAFLKLSGRNHGDEPSEREILHVYAVNNSNWNENSSINWADAPGIGRYHISKNEMGTTDGTGDMIDIEDNYAGTTNGKGKGLGIHGDFVGAVSFHSSDFVTNYLDVTETLKQLSVVDISKDITFVIVRIVRYNVNQFENEYYKLGEYHYDGRQVQIATKEHKNKLLRPKLIISTKQ